MKCPENPTQPINLYTVNICYEPNSKHGLTQHMSNCVMNEWMNEWMNELIKQLIDWLIDWLIDGCDVEYAYCYA